MQWAYVTEDLILHGQPKRVRKLKKTKKTGTVKDLCHHLNSHMAEKVVPHLQRKQHQFKTFSDLKATADDETAIFVVDFSENFACGYHREPQSLHFGGSKGQVTLHTGVAYVKKEAVSFCTVSESYRHDPPAIWAYLTPVVEYLLSLHPQIRTIHIWSDGPSTQYRNKANFWLFSQLLPCLVPGLSTSSTWNISEAGHGKGAADAVGGTVKRTAQALVDHGTDIPSAMDFFQLLDNRTKVKMFYVNEDAIESIAKKVPELKPVKGTMALHQVGFSQEGHGNLLIRDLSCFCAATALPCDCHGARSVSVHRRPAENNEADLMLPSSYEGSEADQQPNEFSEADQQARGANEADQPASGSDQQTNEAGQQLPSSAEAAAATPANPEYLVGEWCIVLYDGKLYPGQIKDADDEGILVSTLLPKGQNKFVQPMTPDDLWYVFEDVVAYISEPQKASERSRFMSVDDCVWRKVQSMI